MRKLDGRTVGEIRAMARADAARVLSSYWDGVFPVNPVALARAAGASVFVAELGEDTYGMLVGDAAGQNIYVDRDQPPSRRRFTVAHELGHMVSHIDEPLPEGMAFVDARSEAGRGTAPEVYANEFAGNVLMPADEVRACVAQGMDTIAMAAYFGVSLSAMSYRREVLGE